MTEIKVSGQLLLYSSRGVSSHHFPQAQNVSTNYLAISQMTCENQIITINIILDQWNALMLLYTDYYCICIVLYCTCKTCLDIISISWKPRWLHSLNSSDTCLYATLNCRHKYFRNPKIQKYKNKNSYRCCSQSHRIVFNTPEYIQMYLAKFYYSKFWQFLNL